jgi:hypothetical protein
MPTTLILLLTAVNLLTGEAMLWRVYYSTARQRS